jgi:uncharacterized membrane protein YsdA (DUF1294 family)
MKHRSPVILPAIAAIVLTIAATWFALERLGWPWWAGYLVGLNVATFFIYGYDKWISSGARTRVPENVLHGLALFGGTPAAFAAQRLWRHKTNKRSFRIRFWAIVALQCAGIIALAAVVLNQAKG